MKFYASKIRTFVWLVAWAIALAFSLEMLIDSHRLFHAKNPAMANYSGIVLTAASAFMLGFLLLQLLRRSPTIVFDEEGILDTRNGIGRIRWDDIDSLTIYPISGATGLGVNIKVPDKYLPRMPGWKRASTKLGIGAGLPFTFFPFLGLTPEIMGAEEYIRNHHPEIISWSTPRE